MFKIYLAGAMSGLTFAEYNNWRFNLQNEFKEQYYWGKYKLTVINPVDYYDFSKPGDTIEESMEFDLWQVRTSDLVIVKLCEQNSIGTAMELCLAKELHKPIIGFYDSGNIDNVHPWLKECCNKIIDVTNNLDHTTLVRFVIDYYLL